MDEKISVDRSSRVACIYLHELLLLIDSELQTILFVAVYRPALRRSSTGRRTLMQL